MEFGFLNWSCAWPGCLPPCVKEPYIRKAPSTKVECFPKAAAQGQTERKAGREGNREREREQGSEAIWLKGWKSCMPSCKICIPYLCKSYMAPAKQPASFCAAWREGKRPQCWTLGVDVEAVRTFATVGERAGVHSTAVKNVIIWGNHSSTQ
eukprot:1158368-Pelagomonas_calceolata.AAC.5